MIATCSPCRISLRISEQLRNAIRVVLRHATCYQSQVIDLQAEILRVERPRGDLARTHLPDLRRPAWSYLIHSHTAVHNHCVFSPQAPQYLSQQRSTLPIGYAHQLTGDMSRPSLGDMR